MFPFVCNIYSYFTKKEVFIAENVSHDPVSGACLNGHKNQKYFLKVY